MPNLGMVGMCHCIRASATNQKNHFCLSGKGEDWLVDLHWGLHLNPALSITILMTAIQLWSGLPACRLEQLQHVINEDAKIIKNKRKHDHVTPLLHDLHWLRIHQRTDYKISSLVFKSLLVQTPSYPLFTRTAHIPASIGSDQQPGTPSSNHLTDVRHRMAGLQTLLVRRSRIDSPFDYQHWSNRVSLRPQNFPL